MFADLTSLIREIRSHVGTEKFIRESGKLGPYSREILSAALDSAELPEAVYQTCVFGKSNTDSDTSHLYDMAVGATAFHAVLGRFWDHLILQPAVEPIRLRGAAERFRDAIECGPICDWSTPVSAPKLSIPNDLLGAVSQALCERNPVEAVVRLISHEVASRLGLPITEQLSGRVRRHLGQFISLAMEDIWAQIAISDRCWSQE